MSSFEIINLTEEEIKDIDEVRRVIDYAIEKENIQNKLFNIIIVDNKYIRDLNKSYRNIDRETDVITFALEDENSVLSGSDEDILGDIYISIEKAKEQSKEYNHSLKRELSFLAVHGFYHLLGYDHTTKELEEVMFKKQDEVLDACHIER